MSSPREAERAITTHVLEASFFQFITKRLNLPLWLCDRRSALKLKPLLTGGLTQLRGALRTSCSRAAGATFPEPEALALNPDPDRALPRALSARWHVQMCLSGAWFFGATLSFLFCVTTAMGSVFLPRPFERVRSPRKQINEPGLGHARPRHF
jgi:hypothetical protein